MNTLFVILTVLIVLAAILLIIVVLLQNGKGEGLASNFVAGNQTFGVRQTADILEKITWGLVGFILVVAIISSFTTGTNGAAIDVTDRSRTWPARSCPPSRPLRSSRTPRPLPRSS